MMIFLNGILCFFTCDLFIHWFALLFLSGLICLALKVFAFPRGGSHD